MSRDNSLRETAQLAVNYCQDWQDPQLGGWRYRPRNDSDLSVTGWYVMALTSARMAGLSTDKQVLDNANKYLDLVSTPGRSLYYYTHYSVPTNEGLVELLNKAMTAEGLLCRLYLGWSPTDPRVLRALVYWQTSLSRSISPSGITTTGTMPRRPCITSVADVDRLERCNERGFT